MKGFERFRHSKMGMTGAVMLLLAVLVAVFAPLLAPYDPYAPSSPTIEDIYDSPSSAHLLGTDDGGEDVLSALIYGARVSLIVGFSAAFISLFIGAVIGLVAGYRGGRIGNLLMRFTFASMMRSASVRDTSFSKGFIVIVSSAPTAYDQCREG